MTRDPHKEARLAYETAVTQELARLEAVPEFIRTLTKRRTTIRKLAHYSVHPEYSKNDAFKEDGVVAQSTWYNTKKDWGHHPIMAEVLENVTRLTREYEEGKALREEEAERDYWRERMKTVSTAIIDRVESMLAFPIEKEEIIEKDADGNPVTILIEPGPWNLGNVAPMVNTADKVGRLARGMETDKTSSTVTVKDWRDNLPPGASLEDLEAIKAEVATRLAERVAKKQLEETAVDMTVLDEIPRRGGYSLPDLGEDPEEEE